MQGLARCDGTLQITFSCGTLFRYRQAVDKLGFANEQIFQWLSSYAYQPVMVYAMIFGMMIASGFGLPIPEEVTIISVGLISYMGAHPELFPPPYPGAPVVHAWQAALVTLIAVIFSDFLVYTLGRVFGRRIVSGPRFKRVFSDALMNKVSSFTEKYGIYAAGIFRFTPGFRFPGHIMLGMMHFSAIRFAIVDGIAAGLSVPTQIYLIGRFGEEILKTMHQFKVYIGIGLLILILVMSLRKLWSYWRASINKTSA